MVFITLTEIYFETDNDGLKRHDKHCLEGSDWMPANVYLVIK